MSATISFDRPARLRRPGIIAGVAISLALHTVLLFGYRLSSPPAQQQPARTMTVWLQPPAPPKVVAKVEPPPIRPEPRRKREPVRAAPPERAPAPAAIAQQAQPSPAPQPITATPDPLYPDQQQKKFNMDEALKTARSVAKEKASPGTLAAQLEAHPLSPEDHQTQLQKGVASAKKYDCLQAGAGAGLLAPLVWAFDKHCKF